MVGEVGNMLAYGFAPASVVAPVGSVGVFFNEIIAVLFLKVSGHALQPANPSALPGPFSRMAHGPLSRLVL